MGCWGYGINQSDDALDWESALYHAASINFDTAYFDPSHKINCEKMENSLPALISLIESERSTDRPKSIHCAVGYQMLISMLMGAGAKFTPKDFIRLHSGAANCEEYELGKEALRRSGGKFITASALKDMGYQESPPFGLDETIGRLQGRVEAIDNLVRVLNDYDLSAGIPVNVDAPGLIETFTAQKTRVSH
jgi:hypothetical protein